MLYNYCFWEVKIIACSVGAWSRISPTFVSIFNVDYEKAVNKLFLWQKKTVWLKWLNSTNVLSKTLLQSNRKLITHRNVKWYS